MEGRECFRGFISGSGGGGGGGAAGAGAVEAYSKNDVHVVIYLFMLYLCKNMKIEREWFKGCVSGVGASRAGYAIVHGKNMWALDWDV